MAERALRFDLVANAAKFTRGMRDAQRSTQQFNRHTNQAGRAIKSAFAAFSAGAAVIEMRKWVGAARDANRVAAQTTAVIKSTRGAAGLSAKGFSDLAKQIMRTTAVDDDLIQGGENILATFTKIKAGGPEKIFERATAAAVDLAAGLNHGTVSAEGLQSANILLGKALQDPIAGLTRLQRAGVSFSAAQKEQIKTFVEHGNVAKAQGVIIAEVNRQFGGSAAAAVTPAKRLAVTWGNMQEVLGNLLIPAVDRAAVVMTDILEVIDRNRTAFGLLFGLLATGAGIIGTLIVAEKVHRATVDAVKVATAAWATVQKGLNLILGKTAVQASATAAAEATLATSTTAAGTAASGAAGKFALLRGAASLGGIGAVAVATGVGFVYLARHINDGTRASNLHEVGMNRLRLVHEKAAKSGRQNADATKATTDAVTDLIPKQVQEAEKTAAVTQKTAELTDKLKDLKQGYKDQVAAVQDSIESYDGLIAKSNVTAAEVVTDLNNQVRNFQDYSRDVRRLIKAGVDPAAIRELSVKGPQYVHALAEGSNRQLQQYKSYWRDRQREVRGSFAESLQLQYENLVKKIKAMQREINRLKGKTISVAAALKLDFSPSFTQKDWVQVRLAAERMAMGGRVGGQGPRGQDNQLRWLAPDEHVWTGAEVIAAGGHAAMQRWRRAVLAGDVPGLAAGGPVGRIDTQTRNINKLQAWGTSRRMDAGLTKLMALAPSSIPHTAGSWRLAVDYLRRLGMAFSVISTYRPGARTRAGGNVSYHALNRAVDIAAPNMLAIFEALTRTNPTELIYSGASRYKSGSGWHPISRLDPITLADHWSHVHAAYDNGGLLPPGLTLALNRTRQAEVVMPLGKLSSVFRENLQSWVVPWLRRIALGVERDGRTLAQGRSVSRTVAKARAAAKRLTAWQLNSLSDAARWAYVARFGHPSAPAGHVWAEDHTLVPTSFYNRTSFDRGGWLPPGTTMAINRTGRPEPVGFPTADQIAEALARAFARYPPVVAVRDLQTAMNGYAGRLGQPRPYR